MEKYRVFEKSKKTKICTYYHAENLITREIVTIKKLDKSTQWDELLSRKQINLMKQVKYPFIARVKEIVKEGGRFFVVLEKLENNLEDIMKGKKAEHSQIIQIGLQICEIIDTLVRKESVVLTDVRPEHFFLDQNSNEVRIAHICSQSNKSLASLELVEYLDFKYSAPETTLTSKQHDIACCVFAIGIILSELYIGRRLLYAKTKMDYMYKLCELFPKQSLNSGTQTTQGSNASNAKPGSSKIQLEKTYECIINNATKEKNMISLLSRMLQINYKERIAFDDVVEELKKLKENNRKSKRSPTRSPARSPKPNEASADKQANREENLKKKASDLIDNMTKIDAMELAGRKKKMVVTKNLDIDLLEDPKMYERFLELPKLIKCNSPLKHEKNTQEFAISPSSVMKTRMKFNDLILPHKMLTVTNTPSNKQELKKKFTVSTLTKSNFQNSSSYGMRMRASISQIKRPFNLPIVQKLESKRSRNPTHYARYKTEMIDTSMMEEDVQYSKAM